MEEIDIVIPHVDGAAHGYAEACQRHTGEWVPCQVRDLGELRYVLRSIERYLPWVRRPLLVVQDEGHLPSWLAIDEVRVVTHADALPAEHLPTFHWATIAAHLYRIPGLARRFVIWEDDTLAGQPVTPADLFGTDGQPIVDPLLAPILPGLERLLGGYQRNLSWSRTLLQRHLGSIRERRSRPPSSRSARRASPHRALLARFLDDASSASGAALRGACFVVPHRPLPVVSSGWARMYEALSEDDWFRDTVTRRSRGDADRPTIDPLVVYANWVALVEQQRGSLGRYAKWASHLAAEAFARVAVSARRPPRFGSYALVNDPARVDRRMRRLIRERPRFFNVNDDAYDGFRDEQGVDWGSAERPNPAALTRMHSALERLFPAPSRFEREGQPIRERWSADAG